jgi:hypothetical protein
VRWCGVNCGAIPEKVFPPVSHLVVGYGAFTVGISQMPATVRYILNQQEHHAKKTYDEEWEMVLDRHGLEIDD